MIEIAVKELKKRQQTITEQIQSLQAEAGKLKKALSVLETLADVVTKAPAAKQPKAPKAKKRTMSAAGRKAIGEAAKARWAALRAKKEGQAAPAPVKAPKAAKVPQAPKGKRPQNNLSLMDAVLMVLETEKAKTIPEIITAVEKIGYESDSKNFATIIGQTLKKAGEKVIRVRRGMYALNA